MGGHGGLNILPQKRWNVYNFDNREKVRRDEAEAAREEQLQREAVRRRDSDLRLAALRRNRGLQSADAGPSLPGRPPTPRSSAPRIRPTRPPPPTTQTAATSTSSPPAAAAVVQPTSPCSPPPTVGGAPPGSGSLPRTLTLRSGRGRRRR